MLGPKLIFDIEGHSSKLHILVILCYRNDTTKSHIRHASILIYLQAI